MANRYSGKEVRKRLEAEIGKKRPIVAAGAGIGLSAKFAEAGGSDLIIIYNSGLYRMDGLPSIAGRRKNPATLKIFVPLIKL